VHTLRHTTSYKKNKTPSTTAVFQSVPFWKMGIVAIIGFLAASPIMLQPASAQEIPNCIETASCEMTNFFDFTLLPYELQFGEGWAYLVVWGLVIGVIWLRTKNFVMTALVGVYVGGFLSAGPAITEASRGFQIAVLLAGVAVAVALYYLYKHRLSNPY
jgi:hypothetical protein